ncbi:MAG: ATP-grasp domain-containing protein [Pirellulales bacterium]
MAGQRKHILILGAGPFQVPLIGRARERGYAVATFDNRPENPGHALADFSRNVSTTDVEGCLAAARDFRPDAVLTTASDVAVPTVARLCEALALPGPSKHAADVLADKGRFRRYQFERKVATVAHRVATTRAEAEAFFRTLPGRCVVKPVDASGSRGITIVGNEDQFAGAFPVAKRASRCGRVCLEAFLDGVEVGGDAFFIGGEPRFLAVTRKACTPPPRQIPVGHVVPGDLDAHAQQSIARQLAGVLAPLDYTGPVNFDVICRPGRTPVVIDIGIRNGGNCIPEIIRLATGVDLLAAALDAALGETPRLTGRGAPGACGVRMLTSPTGGVVRSVPDAAALRRRFPEIIDLHYDIRPGQRVERFTHGGCRLGHVLVRGPAPDCVEALLDAIASAAAPVVQPEWLRTSATACSLRRGADTTLTARSKTA